MRLMFCLRGGICAPTWALIAVLLLSCGCAGPATSFRVAEGQDAFQLRIEPDTKLAAGNLALRVETQSSQTLVHVVARDAVDLRALCITLAYDQHSYAPTAAAAAGEFVAVEDLLELSYLDQPGTVQYGAVLANWDKRSGYSGNGVLATMEFVHRPHVAVRSISTPPTDDASATLLEYDALSGEFSWRYRNWGDYNQNGEVGISDLTPLGLHFGKSGPFVPHSIEDVVDGDANGAITISDITPIGANFGRFVGAYAFYASASESNYPAANSAPATVAPLATIPISEAGGDPALVRLEFAHTPAVPLGDMFCWVRPLDAAANPGTPSNAVFVDSVDLNQPPVAVLDADVLAGEAPLLVNFDASQSSDSDGSIVLYEFDFTGPGDGLFYLNNGSDPLAQYNYSNAGSYDAVVRVTDDDGAVATASLTLTVEGGGPPEGVWHIAEIELEESSQPPIWLMESDGRPAIAYGALDEQNFTETVKFIRADDAKGTAWGDPVTAYDEYYGYYFVMRSIGGVPMYGGYGGFPPQLVCVRATSAAGTAWAGAELVASPAEIVDGVSLADCGGFPALVYQDVAPQPGMYFRRATNAQGTDWAQAVRMGSYAGVPDLAFVGSRPAVVFENSSGDLAFNMASDGTGTTWPAETTVRLADFVGFYPRLIEVAGRPAIIDNSIVGEVSRYIYASNASGSSWEDPLDVLSEQVGIAVIGGVQWLTGGGADSEMKYMVGEDAAGSSFGPALDLDAAQPGSIPGIIELDGVPMIAYQHFLGPENYVLKFAALYPD